MRALGAGTKAYLLGSALLFTSPAFAAEPPHAPGRPAGVSSYAHHAGNRVAATYHPGSRYASRAQSNGARRINAYYTGISCVPYAREISGIAISGNAWQWWHHAEGRYARGDRPEVGSVLNFRSNTRMPLGHVAVVTNIVNPRQVIIEQANWGSTGMRGRISRNVAVVDVSEANNWSAVRVELGNKGAFGSVYPTYGFIYNRPDTGWVTASITRPAPQPELNPIPSDLRPRAERSWQIYEEVAESPDGPRRRIDLKRAQVASAR